MTLPNFGGHEPTIDISSDLVQPPLPIPNTKSQSLYDAIFETFPKKTSVKRA